MLGIEPPLSRRSNERTRTIDSSVGTSAGNRKRVRWKSAEFVVPPLGGSTLPRACGIPAKVYGSGTWVTVVPGHG